MIDSVAETAGLPADLKRTPPRKPMAAVAQQLSAFGRLWASDKVHPNHPERLLEPGSVGVRACEFVGRPARSSFSRLKLRLCHWPRGPLALRLFVIDYLQWLHSTARRAENRPPELADIPNGFKSLAREHHVPAIVLSRLNLLLAKQRQGPARDVNLTFLKPYTRCGSAAN
jgi:DnaB-like helicase C terminal domain